MVFHYGSNKSVESLFGLVTNVEWIMGDDPSDCIISTPPSSAQESWETLDKAVFEGTLTLSLDGEQDPETGEPTWMDMTLTNCSYGELMRTIIDHYRTLSKSENYFVGDHVYFEGLRFNMEGDKIECCFGS